MRSTDPITVSSASVVTGGSGSIEISRGSSRRTTTVASPLCPTRSTATTSIGLSPASRGTSVENRVPSTFAATV